MGSSHLSNFLDIGFLIVYLSESYALTLNWLECLWIILTNIIWIIDSIQKARKGGRPTLQLNHVRNVIWDFDVLKRVDVPFAEVII